MMTRDYPVAIIGAGPVGLAAAAHLVERDIPFILFEAGSSVGTHILDWGHVRVFSPWKYNLDKTAEKLLGETAWKPPFPDELPTGLELVQDYLAPLSTHPKIHPNLYLSSKVIAIYKKHRSKIKTSGRDDIPFVVRVLNRAVETNYEVSAIIDASGTWSNPNPAGAGGVEALGERDCANYIAYRIPDILGKERKRYEGKSILVVGSGHSAVNTLLNLADLKEIAPDTSIHWSIQATSLQTIYGGKEDDALEARGRLGIKLERLNEAGVFTIHHSFFIEEIKRHERFLTVSGVVHDQPYSIDNIEEIIVLTGSRPDVSWYRELRVQVDSALESVPALAELIDPNIHSCGTVRPHGEATLRQVEKNFYTVGVKSYGRAPTFLMATGYEQVRSIAAYLDGDLKNASKVELNLPETGVCCSDGACDPIVAVKLPIQKPQNTSVQVQEEANQVRGCCGGKPTEGSSACCQLDEQALDQGLDGCGCNREDDVVKGSSCC